MQYDQRYFTATPNREAAREAVIRFYRQVNLLLMNHANKLHRYVAQLAKRLEQQQPPDFDNELLNYFDSHPEYVMDSLQGLVKQLQAGMTYDDSLVRAYLFLMTFQLEHIRYQVDRHYDWARELIAQFQQKIVELLHAGQLPDTMLIHITEALREAKLEVAPQLFAAVEEAIEARSLQQNEPPDVNKLLTSLAEEIKGDEFDATGALTQFTYAMPVQDRVALAAAMLSSQLLTLQNAVPLLVLDGRKEMRQGVARLLLEVANKLNPADLRRLITIRSWLPGKERPLIDKVIKAARQKGIDCAQWPPGEPAEIHGSVIDGSGAQGFMIVSKVGRKYRLSSVLLRLRSGIVDAWSSKELETKRTLDRQLSTAAEQTDLRIVSRAYLDRAVQHHLDAGCQNGQVPPLGLLEVAEVLGAADWHSDSLDIKATVDRLFQELPHAFRHATAITQCLQDSQRWGAYSGITESWFEDDQTVANLLAASRSHRLDMLSRQVLAEVLEPRRAKWAEQLLWVSLWLKDTSGPDDRLWVNFLLVARAVLQGQPLREIPLFTGIASRTVMALRG
jgi:hypothetical protein